MSMTDPIADLLTRIRNAQLARKSEVSVGSSRLKQAVVKVLRDEGYVADFRIAEDGGKSTLTIALKYFDGRPVIELPKVLGGMGTVIVSTPKGVMTDKQARAIGQGGEVLCIVA
jgi:small subunit ribosomal protein S8